MPEFRTYSLADTMQVGEALKGIKRQAETDKLRDAYLGVQTQNAQQQGVIAGQENTRAQESHDTEQQQVKAKYRYLLAERAEKEQDPVGFIKQFAPDMIRDFDEQHGPGTFEQLAPEQRLQILGQVKAHAAAQAGLQAAAPKLGSPQKGVINGKEVIFQLDEQGNPHVVQGVAPPRESDSGGPVNNQLITRPVGEGMVQDFAWNPRTNTMQPSGPVYKPVTPHTGNVTEGERKAAALGTRLELAMQALNQIEQTAPGATKPGIIERGLEGLGAETLANTVRSSDRQQADAAQLDALDAALTLATGAAYTKEQLQNLRKSYFPQLGDSAENVAAKQKRFETIVQTARIASGRAEPSIDKAVAGSQESPRQAGPTNGWSIRPL